MVYILNALGLTLAEGFDDIIDVRAPAEFAEDHIPGAINLPAFSDEERAKVGTIYVQNSAFKARKIGAALLARNVAAHLEGPLADKPGGWKPLVYCWRGGQRSGGVSTILSQIGWRAERIDGGYKSYRRMVVQMLYDGDLAHKFVLLDGNTGSGKTAILKAMGRQGAQVLDLEGMAEHRGSLLGAMRSPQPSQKMFESRVAFALSQLDPARPVFVEAESSKIGERSVPSAVWKAMMAAPRIDVSATLDARANYLSRDYADVLERPEEMAARLDKLRALCSHKQVDAWLDMLRLGHATDLAASLMEKHYDPGYARSRKSKDHSVIGAVHAVKLDEPEIERLAQDVAALLNKV